MHGLNHKSHLIIIGNHMNCMKIICIPFHHLAQILKFFNFQLKQSISLKCLGGKFKGVFIHWTGGLDWTGLEWTGLTQKSVKCLFQCRTEAKHTYSFTKVACIACFRVFLRVGGGQRSRAYCAYLIRFNEKIRRAFVYCRNQTPAFS